MIAVSPDRSRWKLFARVAGVVLVLVVVLITAWLLWPEPVEEGDLALNRSRTPLFDDLERGHWKAGDSVESVDARYKHSKRVRVTGLTHGEYTTYSGSLGRGRYEVVAVQGKLRAAGVVASIFPRSEGRYDRVYFDTLTKEEWAAHDTSYKQAVAGSRHDTKHP